MLHRFLQDQTAVTGIEYALVAGGIAVAIVLVISQVGSAVVGLFTSVGTSLAAGG